MSQGQLDADDVHMRHLRDLLARILPYVQHLLPDSVGVFTIYRFTHSELVQYARKVVRNNDFWTTVHEDGHHIRDELRTLVGS